MIKLMTGLMTESCILTNNAIKVCPLRCILSTTTTYNYYFRFMFGFRFWFRSRFRSSVRSRSRFGSRYRSRVRSRLRFKFGSVVVRWGGTAGLWGVDMTVQLY